MSKRTEKQLKAHARNYAIFCLRGQYGVLLHMEVHTSVDTSGARSEIDAILKQLDAEGCAERAARRTEEVIKGR